MYLCVVDSSVHVYELTQMTRNRHRRIKDISCPGQVHSITILNERICVGFSSNFGVYSVQGDVAPTGMYKITINEYNTFPADYVNFSSMNMFKKNLTNISIGYTNINNHWTLDKPMASLSTSTWVFALDGNLVKSCIYILYTQRNNSTGSVKCL